MILTEYVIYRGKQKKVSDLSPTCGYKVSVECPVCKKIRSAYYRIVASGNHMCHSCTIKQKRRMFLNIGDKYGRLVVIDHSEKSGYSVCECECGVIKEVPNESLKNGSSKSCGCLRHENKVYCDTSGENHPNWKGGISDERERFMQTSEYKAWRSNVFIRDNYTCKKCGQHGYELNAHHIKNYADNFEHRTDVDNGITLCKECHNDFHNIYGRINTNEEQLKEFTLNGVV